MKGACSPARTERLEDVYELCSSLGEGAFGAVRLAARRADGAQRAVKTFWKASPSQRLEAEVLRFVDHPNIVTLLETFEDEKQTYLVQELCEGGELFDQLFEAPISERTAGHLFPQMVYAVQYLHGKRIVHRDLKPENWLLAGAYTSAVDYFSLGVTLYAMLTTETPFPGDGRMVVTNAATMDVEWPTDTALSDEAR